MTPFGVPGTLLRDPKDDVGEGVINHILVDSNQGPIKVFFSNQILSRYDQLFERHLGINLLFAAHVCRAINFRFHAQNYFRSYLALFRGLRHSVTAHISSAMESREVGWRCN